ncbi:MAG: GNAT family N-acetyltransferase [Actinobacteria bacterium]|nr:GNAT family N-acetyltransferase [Actinomycetota bacterium]
MEGVRPATAADLPQVAALCRDAILEKAPARGGTVFVAREARAEPVEDSLSAAIDDGAQQVWVGTIDDVVIAYAVAGVEDLRTGDRLGVIDDIYVEPGARGVGVGEALMGAALEWLTAKGCTGVDAHALPGDRATKNFFEASGFSARLLVMHHRIDR